MYYYGKIETQPTVIDDDQMEALIHLGKEEKVALLSRQPIAKIIDTLHKIGKSWTHDSPYFKEAMEQLPKEIPFSPKMIENTLQIIPGLLERRSLTQRLDAEFGERRVLDRFLSRPHFEGKVRAFPTGVLFHVAAGNVFLGCIDSLLMGFLTKNVSILKLSSKNQVFPQLFARSILETDSESVIADKFSILHFPGGSEAVERVVKSRANAIIAWGGDEMIKSYKKNLAPGIPLLEYGPKISFQVVFKEGIQKNANRIAQDIAKEISIWDQAACASPQNLFLQEGIDVPELMKAIAPHLTRQPPRGELSPNEHVEIQKEKFRAKASQFSDRGLCLEGEDFLLHYDPAPGLRLSPLNRTLIIKTFKNTDHLVRQVKPFAGYLQSCSYQVNDAEKNELLSALSLTGVKRFAPLGKIMEGMNGAPHDGRYGLTELVQFIPDESAGAEAQPTQTQIVDFVNEAIEKIPYYNKIRKGKPVKTLEEMPFINGDIISAATPAGTGEFYRDDMICGYVFSSGGTTGNPKFTRYTYDEFDTICRLLAKGFTARGLQPGDMVANLFMAGNMWSSFMAVEKALETMEVIQLPVGGLAEPDMLLYYLQKFKPKAVCGIPTQLTTYAQMSAKKKLALEIPIVFYAGEHFNDSAKKILQENWKVEQFCSAGYASVDAGPIGYQCPHCKEKEHHLFSQYVHMEIIEGEAVVTSLLKKYMPFIRLKTGDSVELSKEGGCRCGSREPKFKLLGRCDSQINIWGCRVYSTDIEKAFSQNNIDASIMQIRLTWNREEGELLETLNVKVEGEPQASATIIKLKETMYKLSGDVEKTVTFDWLKDKITIAFVPPDTIPRVKRTGKIRTIIDERE
ncbi:MAG: hypothetical protein GY757_49090 [bacterium]|nr:hypothetical protein [bacterium]